MLSHMTLQQRLIIVASTARGFVAVTLMTYLLKLVYKKSIVLSSFVSIREPNIAASVTTDKKSR
jgi:hypothetical protein